MTTPEDIAKLRFLPHPEAERFDSVTVDIAERWKESELSGDEWRFSYVVTFWRHGDPIAQVSGPSVEKALIVAAYEFPRIEVEGAKGYMGDLSAYCCQPGCPNPWEVLKHPITRYERYSGANTGPYEPNDVRAFCDRHRDRGDCALDDADRNYIELDATNPFYDKA